MKRKTTLILLFLLIFVVGMSLGIFIRNRTLDPRATFPKTLEHVSTLFLEAGEKEDDDLLYYDTDLSSFIMHGSTKTKVAVVGIVDKIAHQPDGDYHVIIRNSEGMALVTEFIPEITLPLPTVGNRIKIWGVVRFDILHNWWEIHPVIGWEKH